jgi:hypothetical protein
VALFPLLKRMASLENISKFMRQTVIEEYIWNLSLEGAKEGSD